MLGDFISVRTCRFLFEFSNAKPLCAHFTPTASYRGRTTCRVLNGGLGGGDRFCSALRVSNGFRCHLVGKPHERAVVSRSSFRCKIFLTRELGFFCVLGVVTSSLQSP